MGAIESGLRLLVISCLAANLTFANIIEGEWNVSSYGKKLRTGRSVTGATSTRYGPNVCYVQQSDGCRFRVTVFPDECGFASDEISGNGIGKRDLDERDSNAVVEDAPSLLKLDVLEQRLTKMMEDLSVRSLRHVREIRSDLRQMTHSMNQLKTRNDGNADGRTSHGQPPRQCPAEFTGVGTWKSCYRFSNFEATWNEAREYCNIFGASLLSMDSMKESNIIEYLIKSNAAFQEPNGWWTSGSYVNRSRRWMWTSGQSDHHTIGFSRWASGEPPPSMHTVHCIALFKQVNYHWHGSPCTYRHNFICQLNSA